MARCRSVRSSLCCIAVAFLLGMCQADAARGIDGSAAKRRARITAEARTLGPVPRLRRLHNVPAADDDLTSAGSGGASPTAVAPADPPPVASAETPAVATADPPSVASADPPSVATPDPPAEPADASADAPPVDDPVEAAPASATDPPANPIAATPTSTTTEPPGVAVAPATTPPPADTAPTGAATPPATTATRPTTPTATPPDDTTAAPPPTVTATPPEVDEEEDPEDDPEPDVDPPEAADPPEVDEEEDPEEPADVEPEPATPDPATPPETDPPTETDPPAPAAVTPPGGTTTPPTTEPPTTVPPTEEPAVVEPGPDMPTADPEPGSTPTEVPPPGSTDVPAPGTEIPVDPVDPIEPEPPVDPEAPTEPGEPGGGTGITTGAVPNGSAAAGSPDGGDDEGLSTGVIVAIAAGVAVAATLVIVVIVLCLRKCCCGGGGKKQQEPAVPPYGAHPYYAEQESMPMGSSYGYPGGGTSKYYSGQTGASYPAAHGPPGGYTGSTFSHTGSTATGRESLGASSYPPMPAHGSNAYVAHSRPHSRTGSTASGYTAEDPLHMHTRAATPTQTHTETDVGTWRTMVTQNRTIAAPDDKDKLDRALDNFAQTGTPFLGRFIMLSASHRRVGGQGMVQFARGMHDGEEYAIKFFTQRSAFDREHELYLNPVLRGMMPAITHIEPNTDGSARSITGWPMPPCIVIERGESLDKWALRIKPDFTTILQVLTHVATRLQRLHDNGLVHRDLKPGNVLWRPQHLEWTLIDFGCAAGVDTEAPLSFSLKYAAPEVVHAYEAKHKTIVARPAMDMWALGLMAYELLTDTSAFPPGTSAKAVCDQIAGREPLPWEDPEDGDTRLAKLRMLRRSLTSCLARDPTKRPTSTELLVSWNRLFDSVAGDRTYAPA